MKNTKRAMAAFINFAVCMPQGQLMAFLATHGFAPVSYTDAITDAKTLAGRIGAVEALAQVEVIRKAAADAQNAKRATMLEAARTAWVGGDPHAFDAMKVAGLYW